MGILDAPLIPKDSSGRQLDSIRIPSANGGTKDISGTSPITLTAIECAVRRLDLISATQTLVITVPTEAAFLLVNATNYSQSIKRAGSSKTVALTAGAMWEVFS